jgi:hypothetical protein
MKRIILILFIMYLVSGYYVYTNVLEDVGICTDYTGESWFGLFGGFNLIKDAAVYWQNTAMCFYKKPGMFWGITTFPWQLNMYNQAVQDFSPYQSTLTFFEEFWIGLTGG